MARKIYYVWKDPQRSKTRDNWKQLTGKEFHNLIHSPEGKGRYFVRMGDDLNEGNAIIFIEATREQYLDWQKEHDRHIYLQNQNREYQVCSLDLFDCERPDTLLDLIKASIMDPELITVSKEKGRDLMKMLAELPAPDRDLIRTLVDKELTLSDLSAREDVLYDTLWRRRERLKKRLYRQLEQRSK